MSMATSVFLESFLFYSGFFYPLFLAGQGKMMASGEIISLILRDESLHGKYIGLLAQEIFKDFSKEEQNRLEVDPVNPIVLNGLSTETKTHDFFSTKGNGYQKGVYESLQDSDFVFDREI